VKDLRLIRETKVKKGMMHRINALSLGARVGETWVIEPSPITEHGTLRVERQIVRIEKEGEIPLWIANWSKDESVTIKRGALVAMAHEQFKVREIHKVTDSEVHAEDQWYNGSDKIRFINRVINRVAPKVEKKINFSTQSYAEMMQGVLEKENVDKAKVASTFTQKIQAECLTFIKKWARVFAENPFSPPPLDNGVNMRIPLDKNAVATKDTPTRMSPEQHRICEEHILLMLEHGIIECSNSPWGARVVLAKKKDGKWRFCVDYRYLNSVTKKDAYPLPRIDDTLEALGGEDARVFSSLDVASGYWHIPLFTEDREKTAFVTRNGQYQFKVVPFGLTGAPGAFCRYMDDTLRDIMWKRCLVYVDDIIVWAKDIKEHMKALEEVFERLLKAGLKLKLSKCEFFMEEVEYLGFIIGHGVVGLSPAKVRSIESIPPPRTIKQLQRFLGAVNWMGRWIYQKAEIAVPLTCLLGSEKPKFEIHIPGTPQNLAFLALKKALTSFPVLRLPDFKKTFYVMSDASIVATGAMLAQIWDGYEHPISYYGKALSPAQQKWHPFELETYACLLALRAFRHYITASEFIIVTDCRALTHFNSTREVSAKIVRWLAEISQYGAKFVHRSGERNVIPDWQSRELGYLNDLTAEEMKQKMAESVHGAPLILHSQKEGVGMRKPSSQSHGKTINRIMKQIKLNVYNITMSKVAEEQRENIFCKQVVDFFTNGKVPQTKEGQISFMKKVEGYSVRGGVVYKVPVGNECHPPLPYVAGTETRKYILRRYHDEAEAAHPGEYKMRKRILKRFFWPTLAHDVKGFCDECIECHRVKPQVKATPELKPIPHKGAWEFISIDHLGKLPKTKRGYTHVLVIIDRFTRWVELLPIRGAKKDGGLSAHNTLEKLKKRIVNRYGMPKKILTDGSTSFKKEMEAYSKENNIKLRTGKAYKHDTNGMAERIIRTVREKLRLYVRGKLNDWDRFLSELQAALNSHEAWGPKASPFFLNHGFERNSGTANVLLETAPDLPVSEEFMEVGAEREAEHDIIMEEAAAENQKTQEAMRKQRGASSWLPKVGSLVMVSRPPETISSKLEPLTDGPYKVLGVDKNGNCRIGTVGSDAHELQTVSSSRLSKYRGTEEKADTFLPSEVVDLKPLQASQDKKIRKILKEIQSRFDVERWLPPNKLVGKKIEIYWSQPGAKGWWPGTIVGYDSAKKVFMVRYDDSSRDGEDTYAEKLLSTTMPLWKFYDGKK
jgi:hypothetical protein